MCSSDLTFENIKSLVERGVEGFYRAIKQEKMEVISAEYQLKKAYFEEMEAREARQHVDISTKEQDIKELAAILKEKYQLPDGDNGDRSKLAAYDKAINAMDSIHLGKKIQRLPHYFIAQHDKSLEFSIQINIVDKKEIGTLIIKQGDCKYVDGVIENPTLEISGIDQVISSIFSKEMTYQRAFMLGKIQVRGNFILLSKMDQIFKGM